MGNIKIMENEDRIQKEKGKNLRKEIMEWARSIIVAVAIAVLIRLFLLEVFLVEGTSMYPTLQHHERLIVNKAVYHFKKPDKGEIIVFNYSPQRDFIKRVVAVEGDSVEIINGKLFINDREIDEPYIENYSMSDYGPAVVPEGHIFVLGDNRGNSMDSRDPAVGYISLELIKGKAFVVFWPPFKARMLGALGLDMVPPGA